MAATYNFLVSSVQQILQRNLSKSTKITNEQRQKLASLFDVKGFGVTNYGQAYAFDSVWSEFFDLVKADEADTFEHFKQHHLSVINFATGKNGRRGRYLILPVQDEDGDLVSPRSDASTSEDTTWSPHSSDETDETTPRAAADGKNADPSVSSAAQQPLLLASNAYSVAQSPLYVLPSGLGLARSAVPGLLLQSSQTASGNSFYGFPGEDAIIAAAARGKRSRDGLVPADIETAVSSPKRQKTQELEPSQVPYTPALSVVDMTQVYPSAVGLSEPAYATAPQYYYMPPYQVDMSQYLMVPQSAGASAVAPQPYIFDFSASHFPDATPEMLSLVM